MNQIRQEGLRLAIETLLEYHRKHAMGVTAVIQSQWARGVFDGRKESVNVLQDQLTKMILDSAPEAK